MPIRFHGGKKRTFGQLVLDLMKKKKMSKGSASKLAGWIEAHGKGVFHGS
jgi:hypothetical protein